VQKERKMMKMDEAIPFLDLITPHRELESELLAVVQQAFRTAGFIGGRMLQGFEQEYARFCHVSYCVGVNSGTDALRFALMAAGIGPGDAVVTVANTFIATTEAISQAGALPEFVDIDPETCNLDPGKLQEYLEQRCVMDGSAGKLISRRTGKRVAAIIPVHLYGQMADMDPILDLAERYNLVVIEDACQAHGAEYFSKKQNRWCSAGSMGLAGAFSFYPGKNLGACGEAGAVTTNDEKLARKIRMIRDHGQAEKYYHDIEGYNGRLDSIQAGILGVKLPHLEPWNAKRIEAAKRYRQLFSATDAPVTLTAQPAWSKPVYHLFVIQVDDRETLRKHLTAEKIGTGIHYPIPLHLQKAYAGLGVRRGELPVTETAADRILSLPMFPTLSEADQKRVVEAVVRQIHRPAAQRAATASAAK
jgi:dTDP-4-amino-4,6-dideoxygalactose transaminase